MEQLKVPNCPNCGNPMQAVRVDTWSPTNLLLKQLQKIADSAGLKFYHCKSCGKIEFYKYSTRQ